MLVWQQPASQGSGAIVSYSIYGRHGGESGEFRELTCLSTDEMEAGSWTHILTKAELGTAAGWWEFGISAGNQSSMSGPISLPSFPISVPAVGSEQGAVVESRRGTSTSSRRGASTSSPAPGSSPASAPSQELGLVSGAVQTLLKLFSGGRRQRVNGAGFAGVPLPEHETSKFTCVAEHEGSCRLDLGGDDTTQVFERMLEAAATSPSFPLVARGGGIYEWPVDGTYFQHGSERIEMDMPWLVDRYNQWMRTDALSADLKCLQLLKCFVMRTSTSRRGQLTLEVDPAFVLNDPVPEGTDSIANPTPGGPDGAPAASSGAPPRRLSDKRDAAAALGSAVAAAAARWALAAKQAAKAAEEEHSAYEVALRAFEILQMTVRAGIRRWPCTALSSHYTTDRMCPRPLLPPLQTAAV